jgi:hypothetical protein
MPNSIHSIENSFSFFDSKLMAGISDAIVFLLFRKKDFSETLMKIMVREKIIIRNFLTQFFISFIKFILFTSPVESNHFD